jgi:hypothetical protein
VDDNGNPVLQLLLDCGWDHGRSWVAAYAKEVEGSELLSSDGEKARLGELPLPDNAHAQCC